jgi:hypothetical protein
MVVLLILIAGTTLTYGGVLTGSTAFTKSGDGTLVIMVPILIQVLQLLVLVLYS